MPKKKSGYLAHTRAKPDDPIFTEGLQIYTPGKGINHGFAELGEVGQSAGAILTGANLRRPKPADDKEPPKE